MSLWASRMRDMDPVGWRIEAGPNSPPVSPDVERGVEAGDSFGSFVSMLVGVVETPSREGIEALNEATDALIAAIDEGEVEIPQLTDEQNQALHALLTEYGVLEDKLLS